MIKFAGYDRKEGQFGSKGGRPAGPIKTTCPVMRELFIKAQNQGLTQEYIADCMNQETSTINGYRAGRSHPSISIVRRLAKVVGAEIRVI
jgi:DNA-binding XRE family transcriptional regulator